MITYPKPETAGTTSPRLRLIGLGNAGVHLADRVAMSGLAGVEVVAMNTDGQSLTSSICEDKVLLGEKAARGLGAGGDPDVGAEAAAESLEEIRSAVEGADLVLLCAGLGGGTGSGAAPVVADAARAAGARVIALVTLPFSFEGRRRATQAAATREALGALADILIPFENDRMSELSAPGAGIEETFQAADATLAACVSSLAGILRGGSPMPISLSDLLCGLGGGSPAGAFGRGEASGDNRAHDALARALRSPLLDRGKLLDDCHSVIVQISGPSSLTFAEVSAIMQELSRHLPDEARRFLGVTIHHGTADPVSVTLLGNFSSPTQAAAPAPQPVPLREALRSQPVPVAPPPEPEPAAPEPEPEPAMEESRPLFPEPEPERPAIAATRTAPRETKTKPAPAAPKVKQETLQFESVARGRFEKSEPTIVEGEDLDVPTFLRQRGKPR